MIRQKLIKWLNFKFLLNATKISLYRIDKGIILIACKIEVGSVSMADSEIQILGQQTIHPRASIQIDVARISGQPIIQLNGTACTNNVNRTSIIDRPTQRHRAVKAGNICTEGVIKNQSRIRR